VGPVDEYFDRHSGKITERRRRILVARHAFIQKNAWGIEYRDRKLAIGQVVGFRQREKVESLASIYCGVSQRQSRPDEIASTIEQKYSHDQKAGPSFHLIAQYLLAFVSIRRRGATV
jgi:hypothetical protein